MNKIGLLCLGVVLTATLVGCNTMKGAGQDVENTGKNIKETVEHND
jgi:entericidin B